MIRRTSQHPSGPIPPGLPALWLIAMAAAGCSLGDFLGPSELRELAVSPDEVVESLVAQREAARTIELKVEPVGGGGAEWRVEAPGLPEWLRLDRTEGTAPGELRLTLEGGALEPGLYVDTLRFTVPTGAVKPVPVPVTLEVVDPGSLECSTGTLSLGVEAADSLGARSCPARGAAANPARNFVLDPGGEDSVSVVLRAQGFSGKVLLLDPDGAALGEATSCPAGDGDACLVYRRVTGSGLHTLEVSARAPDQAGSFQVLAVGPRPPEATAELEQRDPATGGSVSNGGALQSRSVVLRARVADPDPWDDVRLEVEVRPEGQEFTGSPTHTTALDTQGLREIRVDDLSEGGRYRWRARATDGTGRTGPWTPYGSTSAADFRVPDGDDDPDDDDDPEDGDPLAPSGLGQFRSDGTTRIPAGGSTSETTVVLKAKVAHSGSDTRVRLEVQVAPVGLLGVLAETKSGTSSLGPSGTEASVTISGLDRGQSYQWRARTVDENGQTSPWVTFGDGSGADFHVSLL